MPRVELHGRDGRRFLQTPEGENGHLPPARQVGKPGVRKGSNHDDCRIGSHLFDFRPRCVLFFQRWIALQSALGPRQRKGLDPCAQAFFSSGRRFPQTIFRGSIRGDSRHAEHPVPPAVFGRGCIQKQEVLFRSGQSVLHSEGIRKRDHARHVQEGASVQGRIGEVHVELLRRRGRGGKEGFRGDDGHGEGESLGGRGLLYPNPLRIASSIPVKTDTMIMSSARPKKSVTVLDLVVCLPLM